MVTLLWGFGGGLVVAADFGCFGSLLGRALECRRAELRFGYLFPSLCWINAIFFFFFLVR